MNFITSIFRKTFESPGLKTFFSAIIPIIASILSGLLVTEISLNGAIDWMLIFKAKSFYVLIALSILVYFYYRAVYLFEKEIENFLDDDYCRAYMRSKCLPEAAEKYKEMIRNGEGKELTKAMKQVERMLNL